jgi:hypothetical protein
MLRDFLNRGGVSIGRRHVATLMKRIGIEAIYRKPNTSSNYPPPFLGAVFFDFRPGRRGSSGMGLRP